jgi:hypothetical protein
VKKDEAERAIRHLCHKWRAERHPTTPKGELGFSEFDSRLRSSGFSHYCNFRSVVPPHDCAEAWFEEEFGQTAWR